jgi:tRNA pseudouridine13 synthase
MAAPARSGGAHEAEIGLHGHATTTPGLGGRLKTRIEDFQVDEVGARPPEDPRGRYVAARVRLTNWETNAFVREASHRLGVSRKKIHWSGTKDKRGVTERWFTFEAPLEAVQNLELLSGVHVVEALRTGAELEFGGHRANAFHVVLRDVAAATAAAEAAARATWAQVEALGGVPNAFGPQRFGARRATTHRVGERMLRGDFHGAVLTYLGEPLALPDAERPTWRAAIERRDWKACLALLRGDVPFERALLHRMAETDDALQAMQALPENLQRLFVHAVQSHLFNAVLSERIARGLPLHRPLVGDLAAPVEDGVLQEEWVPVTEANQARVEAELRRGRAALTGILPGTEAPLAAGPMGEIERGVMANASLQTRDFLVPERLEWSSKGTRRALVAPVAAFSFDTAPDDLHPGRTRIMFRFELPAGSYATSLLREFIKSPRLEDYA